jgi:hypothetical protein
LRWAFAAGYLGLPLILPALRELVRDYTVWADFCRAVEHPEWARDLLFAAHCARIAPRAELMVLMEEVFAVHTTQEWLKPRLGGRPDAVLSGLPDSRTQRVSALRATGVVA